MYVKPAEPVVKAIPAPLVTEGHIEDYDFPLEAVVNQWANWMVKVHNTGDRGAFGFGIVNDADNPGTITVEWRGKQTVIAPGQYYRIYLSDAPNCTRIDESGQVKFSVDGTHLVRIWGMHLEGTQWYYDHEKIVRTVVTTEGDNDWNVTKEVHVFDHYKLKAEAWELAKTKTSTVLNYDMEKLAGGRLEYSITYPRGSEVTLFAEILFNGEKLVDKTMRKGDTVNGAIDITGKIISTNAVTIKIKSDVGLWAEVIFDVWMILGYSEEPDKPPGPGFKWPELTMWQWGLISLTGIGVLWVVTSKPRIPPMIVVGGKE